MQYVNCLMMWQSHILFQREFKRKLQEQAKSTQGTRTDLTSSPNGEKVISTHTDKELAKMAGVGTGTIARYDAIMKTNIEAIGTVKFRWLKTRLFININTTFRS